MGRRRNAASSATPSMFDASAPPHPMLLMGGIGGTASARLHLAHRAAHLNSNLRFWVGAGEGDAVPPLNSEPNTLGLGAPAGTGEPSVLTAAARIYGGKPGSAGPASGWR